MSIYCVKIHHVFNNKSGSHTETYEIDVGHNDIKSHATFLEKNAKNAAIQKAIRQYLDEWNVFEGDTLRVVSVQKREEG